MQRDARTMLKPFARYRNISIIIFVVIVAASLLFYRNRMAPSIYIAPRETALELSCYDEHLLSIPYGDIQTIGSVESLDLGTMVDGLEDRKVRCGTWHNDSFGDYLLYARKPLAHYVVLGTVDNTVVFNYESDEVTDAIYQSLQTLLDEKGMAYEIA